MKSKQQIEKYIRHYKKGKVKQKNSGGIKRNNRSFLSMDNLDLGEEDKEDEDDKI
jgi:LDH2 family malate/lactate/ureidoglycolate dehydrogenase